MLYNPFEVPALITYQNPVRDLICAYMGIRTTAVGPCQQLVYLTTKSQWPMAGQGTEVGL